MALPPMPGQPNVQQPGGNTPASGKGDGGLGYIKDLGAGDDQAMQDRPFESLVGGINTGLLKVKELLQSEKVPQEALAELDGITKSYQQFLMKLANLGQSEGAQNDDQEAGDEGQAPGAGRGPMDPNAAEKAMPA